MSLFSSWKLMKIFYLDHRIDILQTKIPNKLKNWLFDWLAYMQRVTSELKEFWSAVRQGVCCRQGVCWNLGWFECSGGALRQNGVRGRATSQGPFFSLCKSLTGSQNHKISKGVIDRVDFLSIIALPRLWKNFQILYLTGSKFRLKIHLPGYEYFQKLVSDRVHFLDSSGTSPSVT